MSDFKTTFLSSGYIYCTFYTCDHLEHILIFNINLVSLGVIRLAFFATVPQRTPTISKIGRQGWWRTGRRVLTRSLFSWRISKLDSFSSCIAETRFQALFLIPTYHPQWWINDKRHRIFTITLSFLPELILLLHHSRIDLVMCPLMYQQCSAVYCPRQNKPFYKYSGCTGMPLSVNWYIGTFSELDKSEQRDNHFNLSQRICFSRLIREISAKTYQSVMSPRVHKLTRRDNASISQ